MREDTPLGVLSIYAREPEAFGKEEINLLKEMTSDLTYGIVTLRTRAERDRAEHNLRLHAERLKHMREIDQAILTAQTPHAIAKAVLRHLRRLVPYQWASIVGYELEAEHPVTQVVDTSDNNNLLFAPSGLYLPMIISGSLSERSDNGAAPYTYVKDILKQSKRSTAVEQLLAARIRSYISIPFIADGQVIGGISLGSVTSHAFDEQHVLIVREVADQLAVAINQARLFEQVRAGRERLQILYRRLMEGQETERHHIARELHDEIGQSLTAVKMSLQAIQHLPGAQEVTIYLKESITIVDQALQRVRNLSLDLRPSLLDDLGLVAALRWYVDRQAQWAGIAAEFVAEPEGLRLPTDLETVCFRVTQEALTNVVRHAHAQKMRVELHKRDTEVSLLISDDGTGFDVHAAQKRASRGSSLGLIGMQERVYLAGGEIDIDSAATRGTDVRVRFSLMGERPGERPPPPTIRMDRTDLL
jgi:signal transduction histidine kinase